MSNYSVRSLNIWNIVTVQYHISKENRKDWILPAPVTITIKFTRILPVPVWPDMSSPAQSFASDMKSPSGRPPSGFWPWQQEHFVLFEGTVFYLADEVFGQELHFGNKYHIWSLIIYELVPSFFTCNLSFFASSWFFFCSSWLNSFWRWKVMRVISI